MIDFAKKLRKAYNRNVWHGNNLSAIISSVKYSRVFKRPVQNAHTIRELVLHITAWAEEVISMLLGHISQDALTGSCPLIIEKTNVRRNNILSDFHIANKQLINLVMMMDENHRRHYINSGSDVKINNFELLNGLIQHHAYHGRQVALLLKF